MRCENIEEAGVLVAAAAQAGLDPVEAQRVLDDGRHADAVRQAESAWIGRGIRAVPAYIFSERLLVSGAQGTERFVTLLSRPELASAVAISPQRRAVTA